ncbi:MAG: nicotinic acid mononucleotide adenylyltransferase [Alphaproteobacteria bacterium]|nr:nicotinic acid mononucleotide adenylyltransferase [Alphaproteobacteria bacterium]
MFFMNKIITINTLDRYKKQTQKQGLKIGILGGSFDPPHEGHLHIASNALTKLLLDEVWFSIATQNILKPLHKYNYEERESKLLSLTQKYDKYKIVEIEKELGIIYTADLFEFLTKTLPEIKFYFIMGADLIEQIQSWTLFDKLYNLVELVFFSRGGYKAEQAFKMLSSEYKAIKFIEIDEMSISSSAIRKQEEKLRNDK